MRLRGSASLAFATWLALQPSLAGTPRLEACDARDDVAIGDVAIANAGIAVSGVGPKPRRGPASVSGAVPTIPSPDVVGGHPAEEGAWPWHVAVFREEGADSSLGFACSGVLIDPEWVETTAYCVWNSAGLAPVRAGQLQLRLGLTDLASDEYLASDVAQVVIEPDSLRKLTVNTAGLALLRLAAPVESAERVQAISWIDDPDHSALTPGRMAKVTGWGSADATRRILAPRLLEADIPILSCNGERVHSAAEICTYDRDGTRPGFRDMGGPLMVRYGRRWLLAGIYNIDYGEFPEHTVSGYALLARHDDWLRETMLDDRPMLEMAINMPRTIAEGAELPVRISIRNTGRRATSNLSLRHRVPDGVTFVKADDGSRPSSGLLTWQIAGLAAGEECSFRYVVRDEPDWQSNSPAIAGATRTEPQEPPPWRQYPVGSVATGGRIRSPNTLPGSNLLDHGEGEAAGPTVIGGRAARPGQWPWQAALGHPQAPSCGGSLIGDQWVLTAAHCVLAVFSAADSESQDEVWLGFTGLSDRSAVGYEVAEIYVHPGYLAGQSYDLALLKLARQVEYSYAVRPVPLEGIDDEWLRDGGATGTITGWSITSMEDGIRSEVLQQAELEIMPATECVAFSGSDRDVCAGPPAGGVSGCFGDSGGPFVVHNGQRWIQVGVVSRGSGLYCGARGNYSIFTGVPYYRPWIAHKIATERPDKMIVAQGLELLGDTPDIVEVLTIGIAWIEPAGAEPPALPTPLPPREPLRRQLQLPLAGR